MAAEMMYSVLIVDDDAVVRRIHKVVLERQGCKTTAVTDGQEAVNLFRHGETFDLVLMDLEMPVMDGKQATLELRTMGVKSLIIGVTSRRAGPEVEAFIGAGLNDCVEKPLTSAKLAATLHRLGVHIS
ncbi:hypothetical protein Nepgr_031399 [Nepenthes gracilis]|uniref:Response regulatory domain-containing protein n=1 Tax=Nepenthes gracilis TaxID=150966 RepID=A0AAD3TIF6_NEPGR|nr:hypothetical protein Nepgr_031399 [Nepenthes gracilis]